MVSLLGKDAVLVPHSIKAPIVSCFQLFRNVLNDVPKREGRSKHYVKIKTNSYPCKRELFLIPGEKQKFILSKIGYVIAPINYYLVWLVLKIVLSCVVVDTSLLSSWFRLFPYGSVLKSRGKFWKIKKKS